MGFVMVVDVVVDMVWVEFMGTGVGGWWWLWRAGSMMMGVMVGWG